MLVSEILPKLKANKYTYYNLDRGTILMYKKLYKYLKSKQNETIYTSCTNTINHHLNDKTLIDFLKKYRAMEVLSRNINHTGF